MLVLLVAISVLLVAMLVLLVAIFVAFVLREPETLTPSINKSVPFLILIFICSSLAFVAYRSWTPSVSTVTNEFSPICVSPSAVVLIMVLPSESLISVSSVELDIVIPLSLSPTCVSEAAFLKIKSFPIQGVWNTLWKSVSTTSMKVTELSNGLNWTKSPCESFKYKLPL